MLISCHFFTIDIENFHIISYHDHLYHDIYSYLVLYIAHHYTQAQNYIHTDIHGILKSSQVWYVRMVCTVPVYLCTKVPMM